MILYLLIGGAVGAIVASVLGKSGSRGEGKAPAWQAGAVFGLAAGVIAFLLAESSSGAASASDKVAHVSENTFPALVEKSEGPVVLDFYATWCGPCRLQAPVVENAASQYAGRVTFLKVDVEKSPELAARYGVEYLPTLVFLNGTNVVDRVTSLVSEEELKARVTALLKSKRS